MPALVQALGNPGLAADDRAAIVRNMGRLDRSAVPALIAALDSPDPRLAADVADVLGRIGDPRAIPHLTFLAARGEPAVSRPRRRPPRDRAPDGPPVRGAAQVARSGSCSTRRGSITVHAVNFPGDSVLIWAWDEAQSVAGAPAGLEGRGGGVLRPAAGPRGVAARPDEPCRAGPLREPGAGQGRRAGGLAAFPASDPSTPSPRRWPPARTCSATCSERRSPTARPTSPPRPRPPWGRSPTATP